MPASIKIVLTDDAKKFVQRTAEKRDLSEAAVVRKALAAYRFLEELDEREGRVVIAHPDGTLERIVHF